MTGSDELSVTPSERLAMDELKRRVSPDLDQKKYDDDELYYRFLRARDFDVPQAEDMLRKMLQWRKQNKVDTIFTDYKPPDALKICFGNLHVGYDKEKNPFYFMAVGKMDSKGLNMSTRYADVEKTLVQTVTEASERYFEKQRKKTNKRLGGSIFIYDIEGLTFANATNKKSIEACIGFIKMGQDNYPERLKGIYVINVSSFLAFPFAILKSFLNSRVLDKFHMYGADGYKEDLLKVIDADELPAFLGGTRTDPDGDPRCKTFTNVGVTLDPKYYIHKSKKTPLSKTPGVKKLTLGRASFSEVVLDIQEPESLIEWEFETKMRDIGFGLFYKIIKDEEEEVTQLVPLQRLDTDEYSEVGMYKCEKSGKYVLLFDNSYSWIRSKEIYYRVTIVKPTDHKDKIIQ